MAQITYDTKVALNENSSIAAINKISADDMNEIKTVVNTNDTAVGDLSTLTTTADTVVGAINEVNAKTDNYSTTEFKTNEIWIDNKPIYRKVISIGTLPNATSKTINPNISNLSEVIKLYGKAKSTNTTLLLPDVNSSSLSAQTRLYFDNGNINVTTGVDRTNFEGYAVIEYTKTTD